MKRTELKEIKGLDIKELISRIGNAKKELTGLVIEKNGQASAKGAKDVKLASKKRRDIAQMWTILRQKQLLEEIVSSVKSQESNEVKTQNSKVKNASKKSKVSKKPTKLIKRPRKKSKAEDKKGATTSP